MDDPATFLARWSRLKRKTRAGPDDGSARGQRAAPAGAEPAVAPAPPAAAAAPEAPKPAQDLPPIDSLGRDSDYAPFMRADVPDALRNQALRRLWQSDPVYANLDGLLEYGEDFSAPFDVGGAVATAYRVLRGMPAGSAEEEPAGAVAGQPGTGSPTMPAASASPARESPPRRVSTAGDSDAVADGPEGNVGLD